MHADFAEIERAFVALERDLVAALEHCHHHGHCGDEQPASITLTVQ